MTNLTVCSEDRGGRQWFYFAVANATPGTRYKLNILNFSKKTSLYNEGVRPVMCSAVHNYRSSSKDKSCTGYGAWHRVGEDVCYFPSPLRAKQNDSHRKIPVKKTTGRKVRKANLSHHAVQVLPSKQLTLIRCLWFSLK